MFNHGTINMRNSLYYTRFFIINFLYHIISLKQTHLFFVHILVEHALLFLDDNMDEGRK